MLVVMPQMLMVKEGDDPDEEEETKKKKKDHPNRVDKKYLWPHGYTPPLKNVRKRRFRKMLRKKVFIYIFIYCHLSLTNSFSGGPSNIFRFLSMYWCEMLILIK